ncbi:MAG: hypothetical protein SVY10_19015 [Thermodesulfobacteriota bacterium]|nr:hypothetical protein [Thermodesulfobacteriota bacterium]
MSTLADIRDRIIDKVKDDSGKLTNPDDYDRNINEAVSRYSRARPRIIAEDITGDGGHDYNLPTGWDEDFSTVLQIEFPVDNVPADLLEAEDYTIYQAVTGKKLRLLSDAPSATESFRVTHTALRDATTIPDADIDALACLAASLCCDDLANAFAQVSNSTFGADSVDHRSISDRFASRAKKLMALYKDHMGIRDDASVPPASAVKDLDRDYPWGEDRLTHPRRYR